MGIYWDVVDADLIVEVRSGAAPAQAHVSDHIAALHLLAGHNGKAREVTIKCGDSQWVTEDNSSAVAVYKVCTGNLAIGRC